MGWGIFRATATVSALALLSGGAAAQEAAEPVMLEQMTVTATRTERPVTDVPASVTVIDREELERRQPATIDDMLRGIPGVDMSGGPRAMAAEPNIRGLSGERVQVRIDGARQNFSSGHKGRVFLDPALIGRVDVLRGPGSALYGSGAIGGVIEFTTPSADWFLDPGQTFGGEIGTGYHSNGDLWFGSLTGAARAGDSADILGSVVYRRSNDLEDGHGVEIPLSGDEIVSGLVKGTWRPLEFHEVTASYLVFNDDNRLPTAANTDSTDNIADRETRQQTGSVNYASRDPSNPWIDFDATLYMNSVDIREVLVAGGRTDDTELTTYGIDAANTTRFAFGGSVENALTYGVEYYRDSQEGRRDGAPRPQYPESDQDVVGLFIQDEITFFDRFTLIPGLRYDRFDRSAAGEESASDSAVSPKITAAVDVLDGVTAYATYAEAFRAPSLTELYGSGLHFAIPGPFGPPDNFFQPNPDLEPESSENKEIGITLDRDDVLREGDRLTARAAYFRNDVEDFIDMDVDIMGGTTTKVNVQEAQIEGFELEVGYDTGTWFGSLGYAHIRGDDLIKDEPLATIPADQVTLMVGHRFIEWDVEAGYRLIAARAQDRVPAGDRETGGYATHDIFVSWQPDEGRLEGARFNFAVENIFDKGYRRNLSQLNDPGRTIKLAVSYQF